MTSPSNSQEKPLDSKTLFWNRVQLILVLVVFAAPIAGAFLYKPAKFNNYGDIYTPVRVVENLTMVDSTAPDKTIEMDSLRRQWVFLVTANTSCNQQCEDNILKMRQLRFMQNNDMTRIRTVFLHTNMASEIAQDLAAKYSPMEVYQAPFNEFDEWTQILKIEGVPPEAQQNRFYIIDPAGNLMMSYPATADPNMMKKDIKRLLKASQIG